MQFFNFGKVWSEYVRLKKSKFANQYLFSDNVNSDFLKELLQNSLSIDDRRVEVSVRTFVFDIKKSKVEHPRNVLQTIFSKYMPNAEFPIFEEEETQEAFQVNIKTGDVLLGSGSGRTKYVHPLYSHLLDVLPLMLLLQKFSTRRFSYHF